MIQPWSQLADQPVREVQPASKFEQFQCGKFRLVLVEGWLGCVSAAEKPWPGGFASENARTTLAWTTSSLRSAIAD